MPEGEVAAPDGIHELADGTVIETAGGLVVSITALEAANEDEVENEFTAEQLSEMLEKAMSKYAEAFTATLETIKSENETLRTELSEIKSTKEELKNEFSETLRKVGEDLEELAKSESATAKKPQEFKATTRAEKAARMGAIIRANNLK
jgi:predicted RNase H-like nuclease (RuvC/YqgF family)